MLPLIIVNPKSASGSTEQRWASLAADIRAHFGAFEVEFTRAPGDATRIAREAADGGRELIIACGGDGTLNETANGILQSSGDAELAVFPSGTGGDFRRTINMPSEPREAARAIREGQTRQIDAGLVRFIDHDGEPAERYFLNVTSFGLAASIIERVKGDSSLTWLPSANVRGRASFALSTIQEVVTIGTTRVRLKIDEGEERSLDTVNFCIANARYFGGGMLIAPDARLADGLFDVVNVGDINTAKILLRGYTLYRGTHLDLPEVRSRNARRVEARPFNDGDIVHIEIDGELPGRLPANYEVVPGAIRLRVPRLY